MKRAFPIAALLLLILVSAPELMAAGGAARCPDCVAQTTGDDSAFLSRAAPADLRVFYLKALADAGATKVEEKVVTDRINGLVALSGYELSARAGELRTTVTILGGDSALFAEDSGMGAAMEAMKAIPFGPFEGMRGEIDRGLTSHTAAELKELMGRYDHLRYAFYRAVEVRGAVKAEGEAIMARCAAKIAAAPLGDHWEEWLACVLELEAASFRTRIQWTTSPAP